MAWRKKPKTTIILTKEVIMIRIEGARARTVRRNMTFRTVAILSLSSAWSKERLTVGMGITLPEPWARARPDPSGPKSAKSKMAKRTAETPANATRPFLALARESLVAQENFSGLGLIFFAKLTLSILALNTPATRCLAVGPGYVGLLLVVPVAEHSQKAVVGVGAIVTFVVKGQV
jgi:hypothetical protein